MSESEYQFDEVTSYFEWQRNAERESGRERMTNQNLIAYFEWHSLHTAKEHRQRERESGS